MPDPPSDPLEEPPDSYQPRRHDHLVEPMFGGLLGEGPDPEAVEAHRRERERATRRGGCGPLGAALLGGGILLLGPLILG